MATDAATQSKHRLPLTREFSKRTSKMKKIQQKLTGVHVHGIGYYLFRTMPWIKSGANLTLTVLCYLLSCGIFDNTNKLYIQWDGSRENVNITNFYFLAWVLMVCGSLGLSLTSFVVSRLEVGHTHFDVDAFHAILSKFLYGCVKTNDSRRSIHTARDFAEHMKRCYPSLAAFVDVDACWDFDKFVREMRRPGLLLLIRLSVANVICPTTQHTCRSAQRVPTNDGLVDVSRWCRLHSHKAKDGKR